MSPPFERNGIDASGEKPGASTVSVHKEVFSYEGSVATSVMEAAAFSLSMVDHDLDDSAIASISFMLSALPLRPSASTARICQVVKSRFLKLNSSHIEYVLEAMNKNPSDIRNIRAYLLTALYTQHIRFI